MARRALFAPGRRAARRRSTDALSGWLVVPEVFLLALVSALWPALIAVALVALASPRPMIILGYFLAGGLLTTTVLGLVISFSLEAADFFTKSGASTPPAIDLAAGLLLLVVAAVASRRSREPNVSEKSVSKEPPWTERMLARESGRIAFLVGIVINLVPGVFAVVGYSHIAKLDLSHVATLLLVLGFNLIMFALIELPLIGYLVAPAWTEDRVVRLNSWLRSHGRQAIVVVAAGVGIYLVIRGGVGLLG
jgi:hypothetical protein